LFESVGAPGGQDDRAGWSQPGCQLETDFAAAAEDHDHSR